MTGEPRPHAATAVEVVASEPATRFAHGFSFGIAVAAIAVNAWLAVDLAARPLIRDDWELYRPYALGGPSLRFWQSPLWLWGVPGLGAAAALALVATRSRRLWPHAALAAVMVITAVVTYYNAMLPIE